MKSLPPTPGSPLTLTALCDAADVTPRTVRYYIQQGLLGPADGAGQGSTYSPGHVNRLRLIKALQGRHLPLAEIRARLEHLTVAEEQALLTTPEPVVETTSAAEYIRSVLSAGPGRDGLRAGATFRMPHPIGEPPPAANVSPGAAPPVPAHFGSRAVWERYSVAKDVEIHVRRPLDLQSNRQLEKLLDAARAIFRDNPNEP